MQEPHTGTIFDLVIEAIEPRRRFAFRRHPHAIEAGVDYSAESMTVVEFMLTELAEGVRHDVIDGAEPVRLLDPDPGNARRSAD